jgi:aminoglycoside 3-N-acetyltransferase I
MPNQPAFAIRRLTEADLPLMRALNAMFGAAFAEPEMYGATPPGDAYLADLLGKPHFIALAALKGGEVVGGLAAYELDKFERQGCEIFVYDLAVAAGHRRQGIASALLAEICRIGAARGAFAVFIQAEADDPPAVALYTKFGVREDAAHFDLVLDRFGARAG